EDVSAQAAEPPPAEIDDFIPPLPERPSPASDAPTIPPPMPSQAPASETPDPVRGTRFDDRTIPAPQDATP
ncbi:MAG TPA: hypothetical protein PJ988_03345, partial [Anaerolinea sp.]|nr:hypothetical protein [Anaerolinea sp.]